MSYPEWDVLHPPSLSGTLSKKTSSAERHLPAVHGEEDCFSGLRIWGTWDAYSQLWAPLILENPLAPHATYQYHSDAPFKVKYPESRLAFC